MDAITQFIVGLAGAHPIVVTVLGVMGGLRIVFKPLFALADAIAEATPTPKDNEILSEVEHSKIYTGIVFVLDYVASIKLGS